MLSSMHRLLIMLESETGIRNFESKLWDLDSGIWKILPHPFASPERIGAVRPGFSSAGGQRSGRRRDLSRGFSDGRPSDPFRPPGLSPRSDPVFRVDLFQHVSVTDELELVAVRPARHSVEIASSDRDDSPNPVGGCSGIPGRAVCPFRIAPRKREALGRFPAESSALGIRKLDIP